MGKVSVDTPPPRDYGQEMTSSLRSQIKLYPELYAAEQRWGAPMQQLELDQMRVAAPQLMQIYERDIFPALQQLDESALRSQRESDINTVRELGPQSREAIRAANPEGTSLLDSLVSDAQTGMNAGSRLTPEQTRNAQQSSREAFAARGLSYSPGAVFDEALTTSLAGEAEQDRRRQAAAGVAGMTQATYGDPFQAILGRPSGVSQIAPAYGGQAQSFNPGQLFNPESQYAADIYGTNYQGSLAANTATAANKSALTGAAISAAGSAASSL